MRGWSIEGLRNALAAGSHFRPELSPGKAVPVVFFRKEV